MSAYWEGAVASMSAWAVARRAEVHVDRRGEVTIRHKHHRSCICRICEGARRLRESGLQKVLDLRSLSCE